MNATVLIIDAGARGHAISRVYEDSNQVSRIIVAPGNDLVPYRRKKDVMIEPNCRLDDPASILNAARIYNPDLIDVAQDNALAAGTVDLLRENGYRVFGPTRQASRIEWDKQWSKEFMQRHGIPTSRFAAFTSMGEACEYVSELYRHTPDAFLFIKAAGLCAGKGALSARSADEACDRIAAMRSFGEAGSTFLIEEGLVGEEFSCYAISDGNSYRLFHSAQDHKRSHTFDLGEQTGGMGAISPASVTRGIATEIEQTMIRPMIEGMRSEQIPYEGILYIGGILVNGKPYVIEYNARWGDPECQVVLPALQTDYFQLAMAVTNHQLHTSTVEHDTRSRVCVVGSLRGYPGDISAANGSRIYGLDSITGMEGVELYGAGISRHGDHFTATSGRVLNIVGEGSDLLEARRRAYEAISRLFFEGNTLHYRTDIGWNDLVRHYQTTTINF